ncbi:zinc-dependent metalloprotease [Ruicaihuangia caeni]|uniref:Zinc-dependent metalloprotease n=1 Tax=Ruicaihuangia caeni TaxID=3042517 RepID=A0AAW6T776_9MICO|nr:zinc-dependent metalloprotease [Klugiella sp. YN-L-19]MDI2099680.1 zinc-dependent metalloprotease [Klugiella sp. YN-L-19]
MADDPRNDPSEEFRELLRAFLQGDPDFDPAKLAGAAGLPADPALLAQLMRQLQASMQSAGDEGVNWSLAEEQASNLATRSAVVTLPEERARLEQALHVAGLWLDEATDVGELPTTPKLISRAEWVKATMQVWQQMTEPVATSISEALTRVLNEQAPDEFASMLAGASRLMRNVGGTLFAMQLGQVVGQLSTEVVSGGDIGIPLLDEQTAALVPQNVKGFGAGLDIPEEEIALYLATRELAHARLFRHAKWLRLHVISSIADYARGIRIDAGHLEDLAEEIDPSNPEQLREMLSSGALIPPKTEEQTAALARLETTLALIEGWVDVVTTAATSRLPKAAAIAETVRRRRATGGPAESAFGALVGLELRPRRLREALAMWNAVTAAVGPERRDELWAHPDIMPTSEDIDDPAGLIARLSETEPERDAIDQAIEDLLNDDSGDRPHEA